MKKLLPLFVLIAAMSLSGCAWLKHPFSRHPKPAPAASKTIVTPDDSLAAKVVRVNAVIQIAVLDFPEGRMPKLEQRLFLYRGGLKVAEVKVVGPQQETSIVAEIISGEPQVGDTVRDQ